MAIFEQIIAALPQDVVLKLQLILSVLLIVFILGIYIIGYFSSSRRYEFYRQMQDVGFTVTRYAMGLIPIYRKKYGGLKRLEVESYLDENEGVSRDCADVYAILSSGEKVLLKKLTLYNYEQEVKEIAHNIESIIHSRQPDTLIIHHCRKLSFVMGLLAFVLSLPWLLLCLWWLGGVLLKDLEPSINDSLSLHSVLEDNKPYQYPADPLYSISDLPDNFPIIDNTFITDIRLNNQDNDDVVWLKTNSYNSEELAYAIKEKLHTQGWETSRLKDFPSYNTDGTLKSEHGYEFYFRNSDHSIEGYVATYKSQGSWGANISIPAKPET